MYRRSRNKVWNFIRADMIWYFAPLTALVRMVRKRKLNYLHQMKVIERLAFGRAGLFGK